MLRISHLLRTFVVIFSIAGVSACGAEQKQAVSANDAEPHIPPPPVVQEPPLPQGHVWRSQVMEVLSPGPGVFLQKIDVEPKVVKGKFYGFRVKALHPATFWRGVDIRVGDVIRRVNGTSIGFYDDAFRVWQSMATAPQLVVEYERAGKTRTLRYVIHDPENSDVSKESSSVSSQTTPTSDD